MILTSLLWLVLPANQSVAGVVKVVVIDAGHGGHDPGAIGANGTQEKEITLKMALLLGEMIQQKYSDIKVVYTRKTDVFVELYHRTKIANDNHADIFISIHCNAADNRAAYGTETFVMGLDRANQNIAIAQKENASILSEKNYEKNYGGFDISSPESYIIFELIQNEYLGQSAKLASAIQDEFKNKLSRNCRGVKQAPFLVLYGTTMPSVLTEIGFISNKEEEVYLSSDKGQRELANAILNAFSKQVEEGKNTKNAETKSIDTQKTESQAEIKTEPKVEFSAIDTSLLKSEVFYKIQFLVSSKEYKASDPLFRNIPDVSLEKVGTVCKYAAGRCHTYVEISDLLLKIKEMGYKDAFIIAAKKDGTKITIQEAKELEKKE